MIWVYFDGGAAKKIGTGGFVVHNPEKELHYTASHYYGPDCPANNMAEMQSLVDLAI